VYLRYVIAVKALCEVVTLDATSTEKSREIQEKGNRIYEL